MYEYVESKDLPNKPFVVLEPPMRIFKSNFQYRKESGWEEASGLPEIFTCYLMDDSKDPTDMVENEDGKLVSNLVRYDAGNPIHLDYQFFNFDSPVSREKDDGSVEEYRRKWLDGKMRMNVKFLEPTEIKLWDKGERAEVARKVTHAKLNMPYGVAQTMLEQMQVARDATGNDELAAFDFQVALKYDSKKPPADKYKVKVTPLKAKLVVEEELEVFQKSNKPEFVPPESPYKDA